MHKHTEYLAAPQTRSSTTLLLHSFCGSKYVFVCFSGPPSCCCTLHSRNIETTDSSLSILPGNLWFWDVWGPYLTQTPTQNTPADRDWHWDTQWGVFVVCLWFCWGWGRGCHMLSQGNLLCRRKHLKSCMGQNNTHMRFAKILTLHYRKSNDQWYSFQLPVVLILWLISVSLLVFICTYVKINRDWENKPLSSTKWAKIWKNFPEQREVLIKWIESTTQLFWKVFAQVSAELAHSNS